MKIETKFDVNNLVVSKYQRNPLKLKTKTTALCCFEVIEVHAVTCMAGTQVFYDVRVIHGITDTKYVDDKRVTTYEDFGIGSSPKGEYSRMREDELVEAPKEVIDLVLGKS